MKTLQHQYFNERKEEERGVTTKLKPETPQ